MDDVVPPPVVVDIERLYSGLGPTALYENLDRYEAAARAVAGHGRDVVLTGRAPIWLYLRVAHALHGVVRTLTYRSGQGDEVPILDHRAD